MARTRKVATLVCISSSFLRSMTRGSVVNLGEFPRLNDERRKIKKSIYSCPGNRIQETPEYRPPVGYSAKKESKKRLVYFIKTSLFLALDTNQRLTNTSEVFYEPSRDIWHVYTRPTYKVSRCQKKNSFLELWKIFAFVNSLYLCSNAFFAVGILFWWQFQLIEAWQIFIVSLDSDHCERHSMVDELSIHFVPYLKLYCLF